MNRVWTVALGRSVAFLWLATAAWVAILFFTSMAVGVDPPATLLGWCVASLILAAISAFGGANRRALRISVASSVVLVGLAILLLASASPDFQGGLWMGVALTLLAGLSPFAVLRLGAPEATRVQPPWP